MPLQKTILSIRATVSSASREELKLQLLIGNYSVTKYNYLTIIHLDGKFDQTSLRLMGGKPEYDYSQIVTWDWLKNEVC